jgi:Chitobiase/beta-hexosaminidase C-terminal domain/Lamin Tail Domain
MLTFLRNASFLLPALAHSAVVISVDVNDALDTPTDAAPGFATYVLSDNTLAIGVYTVDINPAAGALLDDVHRTTPATGGALTLGALYRDCVFAAGDNTTNFYRVGMDAVIGGLTPGKKYTLTAWSFDSGSTGARTSDWSVLGLGGPQWAVNNFTFDGATLPTADTANRFTVTAYADTNGTLTLRGRPAAQSATAGVFLNAFTVDELAGAGVTPATVLALDFNDRSFAGAANTQAGFSEFILDGTTTVQATATRSYGAISVTLSGVGVTVDDRERGGLPANAGAFSDSTLLRDFIFASGGAAGTGLDVTVAGLVANATYLVEVWSFDAGSSAAPQPRTSDWTANGATLWDDYVFNGGNTPATGNDYKMAGVFTANGSGQILISGRLVVNSPAVFLNALRISTLAPPVIVDFGHPILSEFMAENSSGITDEDGDTSDWIEVWNTTDSTLDLAGWRLTDDPLLPAKWTFPAGVTVPSQGFLRVWASGKNRTASAAMLHTNFALDKNAGSHLALRQPGGAIASLFSNIPGQRANVSYGRFGPTEPQTTGYFTPSTPLAVNSAAPVPGFVADTTFDIKRGFYTSAQSVHVTCATPGATIHYTTDGSEPTTASAVVPGAGIAVATTTVLRARAFAPPLAPSNTDTQTYVFKAHTQNQPAAPAGWPATWGVDSQVDANDGAGNGTVPADYEMDPNVVTTTQPGYGRRLSQRRQRHLLEPQERRRPVGKAVLIRTDRARREHHAHELRHPRPRQFIAHAVSDAEALVPRRLSLAVRRRKAGLQTVR